MWIDALDPQRLRLLVEVRRHGSISAAADACRMGQPSATKHLQTLEAAVGVKLIERDGRATRLTQAGEVVATHALGVLDRLDAMGEELRALAGAERGTLALAASTTPGSYVLPSILQCFADRHPGVHVDVVIGSSAWVAERVAQREVSLGLAGEVPLPDGVIAEPFLEDEVIGIAAPDSLPGGGPLRPDALAGSGLRRERRGEFEHQRDLVLLLDGDQVHVQVGVQMHVSFPLRGRSAAPARRSPPRRAPPHAGRRRARRSAR